MDVPVPAVHLISSLDAARGAPTAVMVPQGGQVTAIVVLVKAIDHEGDTVLRMGHTPGLPWIDVDAIIRGILLMMDRIVTKEIVARVVATLLGQTDVPGGVDQFLRDLGLNDGGSGG